MSIAVRSATPGDGAILHGMVRELATHHGYAKNFTAEPGDFDSLLADTRGISGAIIAEVDGAAAGCAIWHRGFSTFRGRETLYLEDLSVLPEFRKRGVGQALLKAVARVAKARDAAYLHWLMMGWNDDARRLYEAAGAEIEDGTCFCSLKGAALERLAT